MQKRGITPVVTRQPGGTATGDRIRELLLDSRSGNLAPLAEMALMFADRAQAIAEVIEPALVVGKTVLCDRLRIRLRRIKVADASSAPNPCLRCIGYSAADCSPISHCFCCRRSRPAWNARAVATTAPPRTSGKDEGRFEREQEDFYGRV